MSRIRTLHDTNLQGKQKHKGSQLLTEYKVDPKRKLN